MDAPSTQCKVTSTRYVRAYAIIWKESDRLLETLASDDLARKASLMACLVLSAFAFEAYLNDVGEKGLGLWDSNERLSWSGKFDKIVREMSLDFCKGRQPWQDITTLFKHRDTLSHGRSNRLISEKVVGVGSVDEELGKFQWTGWERALSEEYLRGARNSVLQVMRAVHEARTDKDKPSELFPLDHQVSSAQPVAAEHA